MAERGPSEYWRLAQSGIANFLSIPQVSQPPTHDVFE